MFTLKNVSNEVVKIRLKPGDEKVELEPGQTAEADDSVKRIVLANRSVLQIVDDVKPEKKAKAANNK